MKSCPGTLNFQLFPGFCFAVRFECTCPVDAMAKAAVAGGAFGSGDHSLSLRSPSRHQTRAWTIGNGVFLLQRAEPFANLCLLQLPETIHQAAHLQSEKGRICLSGPPLPAFCS